MQHPWVILFDIDGTLLTVEHSFNRSLLRNVVNSLGINYEGVETDSFSGRTDHDILSSFLENHGVDPALYQKLKQLYLDRLAEKLRAEHIIRHDFVDEAVSYFSGEAFIPGLLTGNYPSAAKTKIYNANINLEYKIGAFGDIYKDRNMLPKLAIEQFELLYQLEADPLKFVVIGDTPRDIICAKTNGMLAVTVTTGGYCREELESHQPDLIIDSLKDPQIWFPALVNK